MEIDRENLSIFNESLFSDDKLKLLISSLDKLELLYRLKSQQLPSNEYLPHYHWQIRQQFSFENRNHLTLRLKLTKQMIPAAHLHYT